MYRLKCRCLFSRRVNLFPLVRPHVTPASSPPPLYRSQPRQSAENTRDDDNSVSGSNPGSFIVMMQIPIATNRRCLYPAQHCSKSSKIIRRTLRCIPSYSKLIKQRSLTLFQGFYFSSTRGYSPCSKGSTSPLQEDTHPVPRVLTLLYKRILTLFQGF